MAHNKRHEFRAKLIGKAAARLRDLVGCLFEFTFPLLGECEKFHQMTLASSWRSLTSSGTAAAPVPTIFPGCFGGGLCIANVSTFGGTGFGIRSSMGFDFADMIPFKEGYRGSFNPF